MLGLISNERTSEKIPCVHEALLPFNRDAENKHKVVRLLPLALGIDFSVSEQLIQFIIYVMRPR